MTDKRDDTDEIPAEAALRGMPKKVTHLLSKESERGVLLIAGAYLEEILSYLIRASSVDDDQGRKLLEYRAPAGDFSSKIMLCHAFGILSDDEAAGLNCVRKIRNSAAHFDQKGRGFDVLFDSETTVQQVKRFRELLNLDMPSKEPEEVRSDFIVAVRFLATRLLLRLFEARRPPRAMSNREIADAARERLKDTRVGKLFADAENAAQKGNPEMLFEILQSLGDVISEHDANTNVAGDDTTV